MAEWNGAGLPIFCVNVVRRVPIREYFSFFVAGRWNAAIGTLIMASQGDICMNWMMLTSSPLFAAAAVNGKVCFSIIHSVLRV